MAKLVVLLATVILAGCIGSRAPTAAEVCGQMSDESARASCESAVASAPVTSQSASSGLAAFGLGGFTVVWYVAYYLIGLVFARFVYVDAKRREWLAFRVRPFWWGALCVFDPALGALVYWVLHYSRLTRRGYA
jgi:hypothetical protein